MLPAAQSVLYCTVVAEGTAVGLDLDLVCYSFSLIQEIIRLAPKNPL